jgi:hypothetical protein
MGLGSIAGRAILEESNVGWVLGRRHERNPATARRQKRCPRVINVLDHAAEILAVPSGVASDIEGLDGGVIDHQSFISSQVPSQLVKRTFFTPTWRRKFWQWMQGFAIVSAPSFVNLTTLIFLGITLH